MGLAESGQSGELARALAVVRAWGFPGLEAYRDRARLSAALARAAGGAPSAAAAALAALPPDRGIHYAALLASQVARKSPSGVRAAFAAAAADPALGERGADEGEAEEGRYDEEDISFDAPPPSFYSSSSSSSSFTSSSSSAPPPPPAERRVWLRSVAAFGAIGRPATARRVWRAGLAKGLWEAGETMPVNTLLNALSGSPGKTEAAYAAALGDGLVPDLVTHNTRLKAAMRAADARAAEAVLADLRAAGMVGDEYTWNTAVKAFSYAGEPGRALAVREVDMAAAGFEPTPSVWGSLLVAAGRGGAPEAATQLWAAMGAAGVDPGLDGRHALLQVCAYGLRFEEALAVLEDAKRAAARAAAPGGRPAGGGGGGGGTTTSTPPPPSASQPSAAPTTLTYNLIIKAAAPPPGARRSRAGAADALARCRDLLEEMLAPSAYPASPAPAPVPAPAAPPDAATFTGLFALAEAACDGRAAAALYARMRAAGVKEDAVACGALFGALGAGAAAAFRRGDGGGSGSGGDPPPALPPPASSPTDPATAAALAAAAHPSPARAADLVEAVWGRMVWGPRRLKPRPPQVAAAVRALLDCGRPGAAAAVAAGAGARLPPRDLDRLTRAVADAASGGKGGDGDGQGGGDVRASSAALARLLVRSGATRAASLLQGGGGTQEEAPASSSPSSSSSTSLRLDVADLAPSAARAAILCALADLADGGGGGSVPGGGLVVVGVEAAGVGEVPLPPPPSSALAPPPAPFTTAARPEAAPVRASLVRLLRDDLGIEVEVEVGVAGEAEGSGSGGWGEGGGEPAPTPTTGVLRVSGAALGRWVAARRAGRAGR